MIEKVGEREVATSGGSPKEGVGVEEDNNEADIICGHLNIKRESKGIKTYQERKREYRN